MPADEHPSSPPRPASSRAGSSPGRWQPPNVEHLQELLPAYEVISILGQGGMGAVYKATQRSLDRLVAIKILPLDILDEEDTADFVERFKNEARTMAKMNHPGIVAVYDFGETAEGQLYIVMEFVDGTDVQQMIKSQGKLPADYALSITAHVCDALQYAHSHGVIHRDIKPANILINMEGQIKVADFGLAKATDPGASGITKTNMAMGTPDFVAPEVLVSGMFADQRADLYAVGVMLYNMLTGNVPRGMFKMPSVMLPGTDPRFDAIIAKAMETDREHRYQSAIEVRGELDRILTMPFVKQEAPPVAVPAQQPVAQGPRVPQQRNPAAPASKPAIAPAKKKSNAGMFIGIGAAVVIAICAFFALKKPAAPGGPGKPGATMSSSPVDAAFMREVAEATPPQKQVDLVVEKIRALNGKRVKATPTIVNGKVTKLTLGQDGEGDVPDISPVAALKDLTVLLVYYLGIQDISCLRDLKLESLTIHRGHFQDITALRYMPLKAFALRDSPDHDYSILSGKAIGQLDLGMTGLTNISFVKGMPLNRLDVSKTKVTDLSPIIGLPLKELICDFVPARDTDIVRSVKTLTRINEKPAAEFWKSLPSSSTPQPLTTPPVRQTLDLLALTDPVLDRVNAPPFTGKNEWVRDHEALVFKSDGKSGKLVAPVAFNCRNYEIEFRAQLTGGSDRVHSDVPLGKGRILPLVFNAPGRKVLNEREGKAWSAVLPEVHLSVRVMLSSNGATDRIVIVRKDNGETLADWTGSLDKIARNGEAHPGYPGQLVASIFAMTAPYAVKTWTLRVFDGDAKVLRSTETKALGAVEVKPAMPVPPPAPMPVPAANPQSAIPNPQSNDPRLAKLEAGFKTRYDADAQKPYLAALATLNQGYLANGIARARNAAQQQGSLAEVTALDTEKARVQNGEPLPPADLDTLPASLKQLRDTYRTALAKIEADRAKKAAPLYDLYLGALDGYMAELTKANKIDEAQKVKALRDGIAAQKPQLDVSPAPLAMNKPASTTTEDAPAGGRSSRWYEAAHWVISVGGTLRIDKKGQRSEVKSEADIPPGKFDVTDVTIESNPKSAGIKDDDLTRLSGLKLRYLKLTRLKLTDAAFAFLPSTPDLEFVLLDQIPVTDAFLTHLAPLQKVGDLQIQSSSGFTGAGLERLASLAILRRASFTNSGFNDAGGKAIVGAKNLENLLLDSTRINDEGLAGFGALGKLSGLSLRNCPKVRGTTMSAWQGMTSLRRLEMRDCALDASVLPVIARFSTLDNLRMENIAALNDETLPALAPLVKLHQFTAHQSSLTGASFNALKGWTELRTLHVGQSSPISAQGLAIIASTFPKLEELALGEGASVRGADLRPLASLKALRILDLPYPTLDDESLIEVGNIKSLESLNLNRSSVTAKGVEALKPLKFLNNLLLEGCKNLDDNAMSAIRDLKGLKTLYTKENALTEDGVAALRKAMPSCKVNR